MTVSRHANVAARITFVVVMIGVTLGGSAKDSANANTPEYVVQTPQRRFLSVQWKQESVVPPSLDSELGDPQLFASREGRHIVFDYSDFVVRTFGSDGRQLWKLGRRGSGPYEFGNPTDLKLDASGNAWILDVALARMTVIAPDGRGKRIIQVVPTVTRFALDEAGGFWGFQAAGQARLVVHFDSIGRVSDSLRMPAWLDSLPGAAKDLRVASTPDGKIVAAGTYYTGRIVLLSRGVVREIIATEVLPQPTAIALAPSATIRVQRLAPGTRTAIRSMASDGNRLYVLWNRVDTTRGRVVDTYRLPDGTYVGSYLLPISVSHLAPAGDGFIGVKLDSLPEILRLHFGGRG